MKGKNVAHSQVSFLAPSLKEQLNPKHELYVLSHQIDWKKFEERFQGFYSKTGRPAHSIRLMVSLLVLKSLYNLSDEGLVEGQWIMNPYFQYFSGYHQLRWSSPCAASDLVHFRKRIGQSGVEMILAESIRIHGKDGNDTHISTDTTVQEKDITYPTDAKLRKQVIDKCVTIAKKEGITLRRSYKRTVKQLVRDTYNSKHPKRAKKARSANKKLQTIANRLLRELDRKLPKEHAYQEKLSLFEKVANQKRGDKDKIYSLHEPEVYCVAKGKAHKKYEYGVKASVSLTQNTGIIVGAMTFESNIYDGHTLASVLEQVQELQGKLPQTVTVDRGYRGAKQYENTQIIIPSPPKKRDSSYQKEKKRKHCRRRAGIEPVIGHLKSDHRVARNYLKGQLGDQINFIMAASAFNMKKWMNKYKQAIAWLYSKLEELIGIDINRYLDDRYNLYLITEN